jgi:uncharacterized membrane protein
MKTENKVLMAQALEALKGKWGLAIGTFVVYMLIAIGIQVIARAIFSHLGPLVSLIITGPFVLGIAIFALSLSRNQNPQLSMIFDGFQKFGLALGAYLLMVLFIFLWMLLLIVPGIIAGLSYAMSFYIIADGQSNGAMEAIDKSKRMMYGYKWKLFCLGCRFIGWALLCLLTAGIGFLWLMPYMQISIAKFYDDIKDKPITAPVN